MKRVAAVAWREIEERRFVFLAAAVASLVPFVVPVARGLHSSAVGEARTLTAVALAAGFSGILAFVLGLSVISRELADRRISFYFSRPLSGLSIWAGKLTGAFALSLGSALLILAPVMAVGGGSLRLSEISLSMEVLFIVGLLVVIVGLNTVSVAVRSRSRRLAIDVVLLSIAGACVFTIEQSLLVLFGEEVAWMGSFPVVILCLVGLILSGAVAVVRGRTEIREGHRAASSVFWSVFGCGVALLAGLLLWVRSAGPEDVQSFDRSSPMAGGPWVAVEGYARGAWAVFLVDSASGRSERAFLRWDLPAVSQDGGLAAWFEPSVTTGTWKLTTFRLRDSAARPTQKDTALPQPDWWFLSPSGSRIAVASGGIMTFYDVGSDRSLGSFRLAEGSFQVGGLFLDEGRFRVFAVILDAPIGEAQRRHIDISEFNLSTKRLTHTGAVENLEGNPHLSVTASGERLLVHEAWTRKAFLVDGGTGRAILTIDHLEPQLSPVTVLEDGTVVAATRTGESSALAVFSRKGALEGSIRLPARPRVHVLLGGEVAQGQLAVGVGSAVLLAEIATGTIRKSGFGLTPIMHRRFRWWDPNLGADAGGEASKLFLDAEGSLIHFDPLTGEKRVILSARRQ